MAIGTSAPTVHFPADYDAQSEYETPLKGWLNDVIVELDNGSRYKLYFIDPVRLSQTLADDVEFKRPYFSEPGLVVLPEVTTESVRKAVHGLWLDGYFEHIKSIE